MAKILLIEDEPGVRMTVEDRLTAEGYDMFMESDGLKGQRVAELGGYDLILLDIMLPGRDGFTVCSNLRKKGIETPILILTARNTDIDTVVGLRQGADDYLGKPFDMNVLLARIEALLRRAKKEPDAGTAADDAAAMAGTDLISDRTGERIRFDPFLLDTARGELLKKSEPLELNAQEYKLLVFLAQHPGQLLSRTTIMDEVWGYGSETSSRTVDVHIAKLRFKLDESGTPRHILTIRGRGYKFVL